MNFSQPYQFIQNMKTVGFYSFCPDKQLGEGTVGKTFKAIHQFTQQSVVIRIISKTKVLQSKHVKDTLKQQIKYYSRIKAGNIACFIDILQTGNHFYILRKFCSGGSLRDFINKKGKVSQQQVKHIVTQILKAMFELIKKGIVHQHLVPENILFENQSVKLADFGIQKIKYEILQDTNIKIKSQYKSPQLLEGLKGTSKCDVWALGIMTYELLFSQHPWPSNSENSLLNNIYKEKLKFPEGVQVTKNMKKFIMSCLIVDPNERALWTQIFESTLFEQMELPKLNVLNQKYALILTILKSSVIASNLDVGRFFKSQNITSNDHLSRKVFKSLVKSMAFQMTQEQIDFLYTKLDKNADDQLQFNEFEEAMREFEIPLQGSYRRKAEKLLNGKDFDKQLEEEQKRQSQLTLLYQTLIQNLQKKQIFDLYDLFTESDKKRIGVLDFNQFVDLLRKIDKTLTKGQCSKIFVEFDQNGDKKIGFNQFFTKMCQITGSPNGLPSK